MLAFGRKVNFMHNTPNMPFEVDRLDTVPEEPEIEMQGGGEVSETDVESGKDSDETLSFLRWKLKGDVPNTNPARDFYRRGAARYCVAGTCSLLPWILNIVLALLVVLLFIRLQVAKPVVVSEKSAVPTDVLYSESLCRSTERLNKDHMAKHNLPL